MAPISIYQADRALLIMVLSVPPATIWLFQGFFVSEREGIYGQYGKKGRQAPFPQPGAITGCRGKPATNYMGMQMGKIIGKPEETPGRKAIGTKAF